MIGAMVRGKPAVYWKVVLDSLRKAELQKIGSESDQTLFRAIHVSVDGLDATVRERYLALAVLLEDMSVPPAIQRTLWNLDEAGALETAERFVELSLAQREGDGIRLHDLQLDYTRAQYPDREALNVIHGAVRLSSQVIGKDPMQFASQMVGRLVPYEERPAIQRFVSEIVGGRSASVDSAALVLPDAARNRPDQYPGRPFFPNRCCGGERGRTARCFRFL